MDSDAPPRLLATPLVLLALELEAVLVLVLMLVLVLLVAVELVMVLVLVLVLVLMLVMAAREGATNDDTGLEGEVNTRPRSGEWEELWELRLGTPCRMEGGTGCTSAGGFAPTAVVDNPVARIGMGCKGGPTGERNGLDPLMR